jgi:hypothetical protein
MSPLCIPRQRRRNISYSGKNSPTRTSVRLNTDGKEEDTLCPISKKILRISDILSYTTSNIVINHMTLDPSLNDHIGTQSFPQGSETEVQVHRSDRIAVCVLVLYQFSFGPELTKVVHPEGKFKCREKGENKIVLI